MIVSCVVLNFNDYCTTIEMVNRIIDYKSIQHIVVVDNNSTDDSVRKILEEFSTVDKVKVITNCKNGGYGYGNNVGMLYALDNLQSDYILIANPDVIFSDQCVYNMLYNMEANQYLAVVSAIQKNSKGKIVKNFAWNLMTPLQFTLSFSRLFWGMTKRLSVSLDKIKECDVLLVDCVGGAMLLIRSSIIDKSGLYDPCIFLYCEETVLAIKVKNMGLQSAVITSAEYIHNHSTTISKQYNSKSKRRKMMSDSGYIVLKKYYCLSEVELFFVKIFFGWCRVETFFIDAVDLIFKRYG